MSLRTSTLGALLALYLAAPSPTRADAQTAALDSLLAAPALDLGLLEKAVLERNSSLGAMRAAWRGAEAAASRTGGLDDPMIEFLSAPQTWSSNAVDPAYMVNVSQHLPLFGQRGLKKSGGQASARALGEDYRSAQLDILREARRSYYEYLLTSRSRVVNAELKDLLAQVRRTAIGRYSAGTVGLEDALQTDVEIAMLDHEEVGITRDRRVAAARLNALLQRAPGDSLPGPPAELSLPPAPVRSDSLIALALVSRPELKYWAAQRESRSLELSLAGRQRLPEFTLSARYDRYWEVSEVRPSVGVAFNLPILFGRLGAAEDAARAGVEQMELRRKAAEAQVAAEVEIAVAGLQETQHELHIMQDRVIPATERALRAVRASYENSRATFSALLNAERDLARARFELYRIQASYLQSFADLDRAVGIASPAEEAR